MSAAPAVGEARIEGRVTTEDGKPVAGVEVRAAPAERGEVGPSAYATTDAEGRYGILLGEPATVRLHAQGGGWISSALDEKDGPAPPVVVTTARGRVTRADLVVVRAARAEGTVTDPAGKPVAGAVVTVHATPKNAGPFAFLVALAAANAEALASATTGEDGRFVVEPLAPRIEYEIRASAAGWLPAKSDPRRASADASIRVDLRFAAGRFIDVTVVTEDGKPIEGARVWARPAETPRYVRVEPSPTNGDGKVRIGPLQPVPVEVTVAAEGYLDDRKRDSNGRVVSAATNAIEIRLSKGLPIAGKVVDAAGKPVAGVRVQAQRRTTSDHGFSLVGFESDVTGPDGAFRIEGLPEGRLTLDVKSTRDPRIGTLVEVESGASDVVVTLGKRETIVVRILDPAGNPVPRAKVTMRPFAEREVEGGELDTGREPLFGDIDIGVRDPRDADGRPLPFAPFHEFVPVPKGGVVEVHLRRVARVAGRVVDPGGLGIAGVRVRASEKGPDALTDADGVFAIEGIEDGTCELALYPPGDWIPPEPTPAFTGSERLVLTLRRGVRAQVVVVDAKGAPISGATVEAYESGVGDLGRQLSALMGERQPVTGEDGTFLLTRLDPTADYVLAVGPPKSRPDLSSVTIHPWKPADSRVALGQGLVVSGAVVDRAGRPVAGALVWATGPAEERHDAHTGADGRFELRELRAGTIRLTATLGADAVLGLVPDAGEPVEVAAGAKDVVLVVERGLDLAVRVEGVPPGAIVSGAMLVPEGDPIPSYVHGARPGDSGLLRFAGLSPRGRYALWIPPLPDGFSLWRDVRPDAGEVRVRLEKGVTARGRLALPPGEWKGSVHVNRGLASVQTDLAADGSFEIRGLPEGRWHFEAWARSGEASLTGRADADARDPIEIPMDEGPAAGR